MLISFSELVNLELPDSPQGLSEPAYTKTLEIYRAVKNLKSAFDQRNGKFLFSAPVAIAERSFVSLQQIDINTAAIFPASSISIASRAFGFSASAIKPNSVGSIDLLSNLQTGFPSLQPGSVYYLDAAGLPSLTAPIASGEIVQEVGFALTRTEFFVRLSTPLVNP